MPNPIVNRRVLYSRRQANDFSFESLALDLDIRSHQAVISTSFDGIDNGLILVDVPTDIPCIIDQANQNWSNLYTSNFSTDDGWSGTNTGASNGGGASIGGRSNVYRIHGNAINDLSYIRRNNGMYRTLTSFSFDIYVESTNSAVSGLEIKDSSGLSLIHSFEPLRDQWVTINIPFWYSYSGAGLDLRLFNGSSTSFDDLGESVYIDNFSVNEDTGGFWFFENSTATMPHYEQSTYFGIDADGIDDVMNVRSVGDWKTKVSGDTAGFFSLNFFDSAGAGVETRIGGFGNNAGGGYFGEFRITNANILTCNITSTSFVNNTITYDLTALRGGWLSIQFGSDGSDYFLWINGTLVSHSESLGNPDGSWIALIAPATWNTFQIFANRVGTSYPSILRAFQYKGGRICTQAEVDNINASSLYTLP